MHLSKYKHNKMVSLQSCNRPLGFPVTDVLKTHPNPRCKKNHWRPNELLKLKTKQRDKQPKTMQIERGGRGGTNMLWRHPEERVRRSPRESREEGDQQGTHFNITDPAGEQWRLETTRWGKVNKDQVRQIREVQTSLLW